MVTRYQRWLSNGNQITAIVTDLHPPTSTGKPQVPAASMAIAVPRNHKTPPN